MVKLALSNRQLASVLAGLRALQRKPHDESLQDIATDCDTLEPLSNAEIDDLCERLNV